MKRVAAQNLFYLFIPGGKCVVIACGESKHVSVVASEFTQPHGRCCANEQLFMWK
jgi:hypothetical protein